MKKTKTKRKVSKDVAINRLYRAVATYVESSGGMALVACGVQILRWPGDPEYKFSVVVPLTGRAPAFEKN